MTVRLEEHAKRIYTPPTARAVWLGGRERLADDPVTPGIHQGTVSPDSDKVKAYRDDLDGEMEIAAPMPRANVWDKAW